MDERPLDPGARLPAEAGHAHGDGRGEPRAACSTRSAPCRSRPRGRWCSTATRDNRGTGSFILIDPATQFTCGAGMITNPVREAARSARRARSVSPSGSRTWRGARRPTKRPPSGAQGARGDADMTATGSRDDRRAKLIARALADAHAALHHVELPGRVRRPDAHAARGAAGHPGALPRHVPPLPADARVPRRADRAMGAEPDQPARDGAERRPVAGGEHQGLLQAPQGGAALLGARGLRHLVHGAAPRPVGVARQPARKWSRSSCRAARRSRASRRSPAGPRKDVWAYAKDHDIPLLPLYELGYTSIGCEPCTELPLDPDNPRSGRWQGQKLECGIHIQAK